MHLGVHIQVLLHQCGTEVAPARSLERRGLLTKRGGSRPSSADKAAENPERERCPAACSQRHHHPLPPGQRYSKSSLRRCSLSLREVLEGSVLRCKTKPSSSCFAPSPLTLYRFQFWAGSSRGGAAWRSPLCGSGLLLCEPVKCQGKKFKPRRNRRGEREEGTDTYPALPSGKKNTTKGLVGGIWRALSQQERTRELWVWCCCYCHCGQALRWPLGSATQRDFQ